MKIEAYSEKAPLSGEWIDRISDRIGEFLQSLHTERTNALRIRLALEEALLRWRDKFGEDTEVALELGSRFRRPFITLRLEGENYDPLIRRGNELGEWAESLLSGIGLIPSHSYQQGVNVLQLRLKRPRLNPALMLLLSAATGLLLGLLSKYLIPAETRDIILRTVLNPIQDAFFRILNAVGGPVIFLSVLVAVCGAGTAVTMGKSGRRLIFRFLLFSILAACAAAAAAAVFFRPGVQQTVLSGTQFSSTIDYFLHIFPSDMLSPFFQGNSPQLILIALVLGNALLLAGRRANSLVRIVEQTNTIGMVLTDWVSRLTPLFVVILLVLGIWSGSLDMLLGIWRPLLLYCAVSVLLLALVLAAVSIKERLSIRRLAEKMMDSFGLAFRKASVGAALGASQLCCEKRLGVGRSLISFGMPLGLVIYMPASTVACMTFSVYAARCCEVDISAVWLITALVLSVTFMAATPPLAGVGLLSYSVIFAQLGIPGTMLPVAMVADILFSFLSAAVNQALLQLELLREADRTGALDRKILNS